MQTSYAGRDGRTSGVISLLRQLRRAGADGGRRVPGDARPAHEAETMKLRGALVANVSHELRTPLSMIRLGAETLKRGARLPEKQRHEIED